MNNAQRLLIRQLHACLPRLNSDEVVQWHLVGRGAA